MFDHMLEPSQRDDSNKWSNIGFGQEIIQVGTLEVDFMNLIWSSITLLIFFLFFRKWQREYKKDYKTQEEADRRFQIFCENVKYINKLNKEHRLVL